MLKSFRLSRGIFITYFGVRVASSSIGSVGEIGSADDSQNQLQCARFEAQLDLHPTANVRID